MHRAVTVLAVVVALLVPPLLVTTALRVVTNDWIVSFEYDHGRVPADRYGLTTQQRSELALIGLEAIRPRSPGVALLDEARLPDGSPAFNRREVTHMQDVRDAVGVAFLVQIGCALVLLALSVALAWRRSTRPKLLRAWRIGAAATLVIAAVLGLFMLVAWNSFFVDFHGLFFSGDTWRFAETDTLLRLYPDEFWMGVAAWMAGITVALAVAIAVGTTLALRRVR